MCGSPINCLRMSSTRNKDSVACVATLITTGLMAYEPKTEAGKKAIANGADPEVIEEQEADGTLNGIDEEKKPDEKHIEKTAEELAAEAEAARIAAESKGEDDPEKPGRTPQSMPIWKHKEELKQMEKEMEARHATELETALAKVASQKGGSTSEDVGKLAEEFNVTPEVAGAMLDRMTSVIESRLGINEIKTTIATSQQRDKEIKEAQGFEAELGGQAAQDALKVVLGDRPVTAEVKAKVKELAYTTTYANYSVADIIRLNPSLIAPAAPTGRTSAESGKGGAGRAPASPTTLDDLTPEQIDQMSDSEFEEFTSRIGGGNSRFTRTTVPKGRK